MHRSFSRATTHWRSFWATATVLIVLGMAVLACTANDTLFIRLTETPTPSITPTPLAIQTKLQVGGKGIVVGLSDFAAIQLARDPGPFAPGAGTTTCFPNTKVEVKDVSRNLKDQNDLTIYYQVNCAGGLGWVAEYQISAFGRGDSAMIKSEDGKGAPLFSSTDSTRTTSDVCAEGTSVSVRGVSANQFNPSDQNIYVQITCGDQSGYVLDKYLVPQS